MCGRFDLHESEDSLARVFNVPFTTPYFPNYNICPDASLLTVALDDKQMPQWQSMKWGFIPHWDKSEKPRSYINARAETASEKPSFRQAMKSYRCLIPANGFFEWHSNAGGK